MKDSDWSKDAYPQIPVKGDKFESGVLQYQVTKSDAKGGTVAVIKLLKKNRKITIPATVEKDGYTFKVTSISKGVFQKNKKLKEVVFGVNITNIGAKSFF